MSDCLRTINIPSAIEENHISGNKQNMMEYPEKNIRTTYSVMQLDGKSILEISSWTALTWYTVMKTDFKIKIMKRESL